MRITELSRQKTHAPLTSTPVLVEIPAEWVPYLIQGLEPYKLRFLWGTDGDYSEAYNQVCDVQRRLLEDMSPTIVQAIDRVYMAIRQLSTGEQFITDISGNPPVLPTVPPALASSSAPGLLAIVRELQGLQSAGLFGIGEEYASLADVWRALQPATEDTVGHWVDKLDLLGDANDVSSLWQAFRGTVADTATVAEGGGVLALLLVGLGTLAATMGVQAGQMDTLLARMQTLLDRLGEVPASAGEVGVTTIAQELDATRVMLQG